jgi:hypothetical protein
VIGQFALDRAVVEQFGDPSPKSSSIVEAFPDESDRSQTKIERDHGDLIIWGERSQRLTRQLSATSRFATELHYRGTAIWPDGSLDLAPTKTSRSGGIEVGLSGAASSRHKHLCGHVDLRTIGWHIVAAARNGMLRLRHGVTGRLIQ